MHAQTETGERALLAATVEDESREIEQRWFERVKASVGDSHHPASAPELRNAIPPYLRRVAELLREDHATEEARVVAWKDVAREHALTRVRVGFDIDQLVREFILLRQVITEVARERGANGGGDAALADVIDAAIAASVKSYVDSRDYATRQAEAEHIGFLTHELRNPLTTALITASRLKRNLDLASRYGRALELLERSLFRLRDLIDRVLLTERLEAGKVTAQAAQTTLRDVTEAALAPAQLQARERGLALDVDVDLDTPVFVDRELTVSALQNLVDNAIKFTDEGRVQVIAEERANEVMVHVYDNCHGLSPQELAIIFEPFRRGHSQKPGTGLGLSIARRAIEAQGGMIGAESDGERGCHFWVTLPKPRH